MAVRLRTNVKSTSVKLLLWAIVALILIDLLAKFGITNLSNYIGPAVIPIVASLFILIEIGIMQVFKGRKRLDGISLFGAIVAIIALIGVLIGTFTIAVPGAIGTILETSQGFVDIALIIFVVIEIFRK